MDQSSDQIPKEDLERLRRMAEKPWSGATIAHLRFQKLIKDFK